MGQFGHGHAMKGRIMNKTRSVAEEAARNTATPGSATRKATRLDPAKESLKLAPDQLDKRASATTEVLTAILDRDKRAYSFRHWGINE